MTEKPTHKGMVMASRRKETVTRSYDYRLPKEVQADCLRTLDFLLPVENDLIKRLWSEEFLKALKSNCLPAQVWKRLDEQLERPDNVPSRIWRGVLEQVGRILKTQADKQDLFYFLKGITTDEQQWCWQLSKDNGRRFVKANYIYSLKEAVERHKRKNDGAFPENYFDITRCPRLRNGIITYAPDDGQAIRYELEGTVFKVRLKVLSEESKWVWKETFFELPKIVFDRLKDGIMKSPDLRQRNGKVFLDLKIETRNGCTAKNTMNNSLFVDWGVTRKLLTMMVVTPDGTQIGPPIFLKYDPVLRKLHRIQQAIDHLKKKRAKIPRRKDRRGWGKYTALISQAWDKYHELQKELAHLTSNVLIDIAEAYNCDSIYVEDLATLRAKKYSRWLNRVINNTIRSQIYNKVEYKGKLKGIKLHKPVKAWHTSTTCPRCGEPGKRYTAPNGIEKEGGGWFISDCYSADADCVACLNLARRVLYGFSLRHSKQIGYTPVGTLAKQFRRGVDGLRNLQRSLSGWTSGVVTTPKSVLHPLRA